MLSCLGLILAIVAASPSEPPAEAVVVFASAFGESADRDFNDWPDRWTRRRAPGFPPYVKARLDFEATDDTHGLLRIDVDGAGAEVISPLVPADGQHEYAAQARVRTAGLERSRAEIVLTFLNEQKQPIHSWQSRSLGGDSDWTMLTIAPVNLPTGQPRYLTIGLRVDGGESPDLRGIAWFGDVRVTRHPRLTVRPSQKLALYGQPADCEVNVAATGFPAEVERIRLEVLDHSGVVRESEEISLPWRTAPQLSVSDESKEKPPAEFHAEASVHPKVTSAGYYRVRACATTPSGLELSAECPLTIAPAPSSRAREFGWSLAPSSESLPIKTLLELLDAAGAGSLKLSLWEEEAESPESHARARLMAELAAKRVRCVGILAKPPESLRAKLGDTNLEAIANVLTTPASVWFPSVQTTFVRYGLEVRHWQLGADHDRSFVGFPKLPNELSMLKRQLESSGERFRLGIGWDWTDEFPSQADAAIDFLVMSSRPPLGAGEVGSYAGLQSSGPARWAHIDPAWLETLPPEQRASALSWWMIRASAAGADATFFVDPQHPGAGLFDAEGRPTSLFLPWRTTAHALDGAERIGRLQLSAGTENEVFARGDEAIVAIWAETPREERLPLAAGAHATALYGAAAPVIADEQGIRVPLDSEPKFITGVDARLVRWQLGLGFDQDSLPSIPGKAFERTFRLANPFPQLVTGRVRLTAPRGWSVTPRDFEFSIPAGAEFTQTLRMILPYGAESGPQAIQIECELFADQPYRCQVERAMRVGEDDLLIEVDSQLSPSGELILEPLVINNSDQPVQLLCSLFAKGRRRQHFQLTALPNSQTTSEVRIREGRELVGETLWLQAVEAGTRRVFNYRFVARE